MWYSLFLLSYKPVQHVTVLNTVGNCNTMVVLLYYGTPSYMWSVVDRNVLMRRMTVLLEHHFVNTLCHSDMWRPSKGNPQRVLYN